MSTLITKSKFSDESKRTRNLYDNYDNLISVVKYDQNNNVDYVLKTKNSIPGKNVENQKFEQIQIDVNKIPTNIRASSVTLRGRVYKNNNSKIYELGFIYWIGNPNENILDKQKITNFFNTPSVFKGDFSLNVSNLQDNSVYNYRAYVIHEYGTNFSDVKQFSTTNLTSEFSIVGDKFSGPAPLTVNLSAVNAGFGNYSYVWNMTGGEIDIFFPLNSINVTFSGEGYTPLATNYTIDSITIDLSGYGYNASDDINVLVNNVITSSLTANFSYNASTSSYGITSVDVPVDGLSGFNTSDLKITFAPNIENDMFFVGLGDGNNSPYTDEALIANSIQALNPAPEFIIHTGDINQDETQASFNTNVVPLWENSPLLSAMYISFGNHDLSNAQYGEYILDYLTATRDELGSQKIEDKFYCYDFVKGLCHFFVINTGNNDVNNNNDSEDIFARINDQLDEIIPKIEESTARWKVFVCHRPPYTNDQFHRPGLFGYNSVFWQNIKSRLNFSQLGIDLVLNGHGHQYSVFQKDGVYFIQNGVGGATRRDGIQPFISETVTVINQKVGYIKYYVNYNQIRWEFVDVENNENVLDSKTLTKNITNFQAASGTTTGRSYEIPRENYVIVDGTYQPSLSVITDIDAETGLHVVRSVEFLEGPIVYTNSNTRVVQISSNGAVTLSAVLTPVSNTEFTNADYLTRTITHTYLSAGIYTPKVYAILNNQIDKQAIRIVRVNNSTNFTVTWTPVLTSNFANNIVAAYDFRNIAGPVKFNEYPAFNFNCETNNIIAGYSNDLPSVQSSLFYTNYSRLLVTPIGYVESLPTGGYNTETLFGESIVGEKAFNFDVGVGGYGRSFSTFTGTDMWNRGNSFTLSMWVKMIEFKEPGTKIFSLGSSNNREFSITQSTSALHIFKNTELNEVIAGYMTVEPIAGYFQGFPMLYTTESSKLLTPNEWNHIAITRDRNHNYKYYKNGVLMLSALDAGYNIGGYDNYGGQLGFGGVGGYGIGGYINLLNIGNTNRFSTRSAAPSGLIDSVSCWQKAFNQEEIDELYNGGIGTEDFSIYYPIVGPRLFPGGIGANYFRGVGGYDALDINTVIDTNDDLYWDDVSLYVDFDGEDLSTDILDKSTSNVQLSAINNTHITTENKKYGTGSVRFDGLNSYIQTLSSDNYGDVGREDYTVEWWDYITGNGEQGPNNQYYSPIIFYGNPGIARFSSNEAMTPQWGVAKKTTPTSNTAEIKVYDYGISNNNKYYNFTDNTFALSGWIHNAVQKRKRDFSNVYDFSYYKNGVLAGYATDNNYSVNGFVNNYGTGEGLIGAAFIGGYNTSLDDASWYYFDGFIDDLRVTKNRARYNSNFSIPLTSYPTKVGTFLGTKFKPTVDKGGSYAIATETVPVTYPHTIAFVGKVNSTSTDRTVLQNIQTYYDSRAGNINLDSNTTFDAVYSIARPIGQAPGLKPSNSSQSINYTPAGNEWFYISYSFLGPNANNNIRYYLQTPTLSSQGILQGSNTTNFEGLPGFGIGGYALVSNIQPNSIQRPINTINGTALLGMYINQGFNTHSNMVELFNTIKTGPAKDIDLV
jgi:predicted phosphodiesterase